MIQDLFVVNIKEANKIAAEINSRFMLFDEDSFSIQCREELVKYFTANLNWLKKAVTYYNNSSFTQKGSDFGKVSSDNDREVNVKPVIDGVTASMNNNKKFFNKISKAIEALRKEASADSSSKLLEAVSKVLGKEPAGKSAVQRKEGQSGRKAKPVTADRKVKASLNSSECPDCHSTDTMTRIGAAASTLKAQSDKLGALLEICSNENDVYICEECGRIVIPYTEKQDFPVTPNRTIGMSVLAGSCEALYHSCPLQRYFRPMQDFWELGSNALYDNLHQYVKIILTPLFNSIYDKCKELEYLAVDETPFDCLHDKGQGNLSREQKKRILAGEFEKRSKSYIETLSSITNSDTSLVVFKYIKSCSAEAISDVIADDFKCRYLISDAYSVYKNICQEKGIKLQNCIVHLRRLIIGCGINAKILMKECESLTDDGMKNFIGGHFKKDSEFAALIVLLFCICKIYEFEAAVPKDDENYIEYKQENRKGLKEIFSIMDNVIEDLVPENAELKNTKYVSTNRTAFAKMVVYYKNHRKFFDTFLEDWQIPPDSNIVERHIRAMSVIRNAIHHKVSSEGLQDMCIIYTVFRTLELNGHNPVEFLSRYQKALYIYRLEKKLDHQHREGFDVSKKADGFDEKLSEGFDITPLKIFKD